MAKKEMSGEKTAKLKVDEIIEYCKSELGISFNLMDENAAKDFLKKNNYFFRLKQYCSICAEKTKSGKYIGLDFGQLVEISTIDMFLRKILLKMTIDLEHYLKVKLVNDCQENPADDGYEVVENFLELHPQIKSNLDVGSKLAGYGRDKFEKYKECPAVWNFIEMIGFLDLINFYSFYYAYFRKTCEYTKHFDSVRHLRNACAHNICMLTNFKPVQNFKADLEINFELLQANLGISNGTISNCMKVPVLNDFAVMLSVYTRLVSSAKVKEKTLQELKDFFTERAVYRKHYFENFIDIKNAYQFANAVLDYFAGK